jgi:hypothetical protein
LNVHKVSNVRQIEIHAAGPFEVATDIANLKKKIKK